LAVSHYDDQPPVVSFRISSMYCVHISDSAHHTPDITIADVLDTSAIGLDHLL